MDKNFSAETKVLVGKAQEFALDLGYNQVSTVHFFIANCKMDGNYNPREFLFPNEGEFQNFYNSQRIGEPKKIKEKEILSLTNEAEKTIRLSLKLKRKIKSKQVQPIQLLLAATQISDSLFLSLCFEKENAYSQLLDFYKSKGYLKESPSEGFFQKIKKFLFKS
mgnify:CR=1 FL=1